MNTNDRIRLIVDTNVWISSLIGRSLIGIHQIFNHPLIELITTPHLIEEIEIVTSRPKFSNFFSHESVSYLINWMRDNGYIERCTIMTVAQFEEEWIKLSKELENSLQLLQ